MSTVIKLRPVVCLKHSKWMAACTDCCAQRQPIPTPRRAA